MRLLAPALSYGLARLPQLGALTTARLPYIPLLGLLNTTARAAIPPLFSSPFIVRATIAIVASYLLSSTLAASSSLPSSSTLYSSRRIVQLPTVCHCESCANNRTKLVDLLAASYLQSSLPLASFSPPSSSTSYSSRRVVQLPTVCPFESCANNLMKLVDLLAASYLLSSSRWHPHRHRHRHCTYRIVLYNFPLSVPLRAALTIS